MFFSDDIYCFIFKYFCVLRANINHALFYTYEKNTCFVFLIFIRDEYLSCIFKVAVTHICFVFFLYLSEINIYLFFLCINNKYVQKNLYLLVTHIYLMFLYISVINMSN